MAYFTVATYLYYILQDRVGRSALPGHNAAIAVSQIATIQVIAWLIAAVLAGVAADRLGRRKPFVWACAAGMGLAMLVPLASATWTAMLVFAVLSGAFFGGYIAVDLALMASVLPDPPASGRDLGILAVATGGPQLFSGPLAGLLVTRAGGYPALFAFAAAVSGTSGVTALRIRSIR